MSIVVRLEIQCDNCRQRREWSFEQIANRVGKTKGSGFADLRKEARNAGWRRRKIGHRLFIDLCGSCLRLPTPKPVWFQHETPKDEKRTEAKPGWFEEYRCGCSFMSRTKKELPGYCAKHGDSRRNKPVKLPNVDNDSLGFA